MGEVRTYVLIFAFIHVILLAGYIAFPVWDTQFSNLNFTGNTTYNAYTWVWWFLFVFIVFNLILVMLLFVVVAETNHKPPGDLHFIVTILTVIVNLVFLVLCVIIYFFFRNNVYSGNLPFNDPLWCCVYYLSNPDQCPNTLPCVASVQLDTPYVFILHWIFSGVFFLMAILHVGINKLLRNAKVIPSISTNASAGRLMGVVISLIYLLLFVYWAAFPLWDTIFIDGFPLFGIPPGPGPFYSTRYSYQWWFLWMLTLNFMPPYLFFIAAIRRKSYLASSAYFWLSFLVQLITFVAVIVFICVWIFSCNYWFSGDSICNSPLYCCQHFADAPGICPNVTPCIAGNVTLYPNPDFIQHIIFGFIFLLAGIVELWMYYRLRKYRTIK